MAYRPAGQSVSTLLLLPKTGSILVHTAPRWLLESRLASTVSHNGDLQIVGVAHDRLSVIPPKK